MKKKISADKSCNRLRKLSRKPVLCARFQIQQPLHICRTDTLVQTCSDSGRSARNRKPPYFLVTQPKRHYYIFPASHTPVSAVSSASTDTAATVQSCNQSHLNQHISRLQRLNYSSNCPSSEDREELQKQLFFRLDSRPRELKEHINSLSLHPKSHAS